MIGGPELGSRLPNLSHLKKTKPRAKYVEEKKKFNASTFLLYEAYAHSGTDALETQTQSWSGKLKAGRNSRRWPLCRTPGLSNWKLKTKPCFFWVHQNPPCFWVHKKTPSFWVHKKPPSFWKHQKIPCFWVHVKTSVFESIKTPPVFGCMCNVRRKGVVSCSSDRERLPHSTYSNG